MYMYVVSLYESRLCVVLEVNATKKVVKIKKKKKRTSIKKKPEEYQVGFFYTCTYDSRLLVSFIFYVINY